MSQHIAWSSDPDRGDPARKYVFGWDQPLQSFFLQVHEMWKPEDERIAVWLGATADTKMYEVEDLVREARKQGLLLDHSMWVILYGEKDDGV